MSVDPETEALSATGSGGSQSIGAQLVAARKARQLDIEKVAAELKLDVAIIRALESDNQAALPAPIFVKGYLRSYARLVGLAEDELVRTYNVQAGDLPPLTVSRLATRPARLLRLPSTRMLRNVVMLLLLGIMIWLAWPVVEGLLQSRGETPDETQQGQLELPPTGL